MTAGHLDRALLLARTVRHLQPAQIVHRGRLRAQKLALARFPRPVAKRLRRPVPPEPGWPPHFLALDGRLADGFPDPEVNAKGRFRFLNEERDLGHPPDWGQTQATQLWRYHLHYFEWAWSFTHHPNRSWASAEFRRLWRSWRDATTFGRWDAWSPYVTSLRGWALCGLFSPLVDGTEDEGDFLDDLALHAGLVRANLELDVGGNHLIKNLKALVGLGVFLHDEDLIHTAITHVRRQLGIQVLADGGHYERSPSYHCQVQGDLIDVRDLLRAAQRPLVAGLDQAIISMRRWLGAMLMPDGDVPLFNDCTLVGHRRLALLEPAQPPARRLTVLGPSGYVVVRPDERMHLVADVGPPCPPELPAHAHADCLSFELAVDGKRVIVDTGTSTYTAGPRRAYERSTAAHNTVTVDQRDQTEVWGAFRAGRRAMPALERSVEDDGAIVVQASHDGYERLPGRPRHRRTWQLSPGTLQISDEVLGEGRHSISVSFVLAPSMTPQPLDKSRVEVGPLQVSVVGGEFQTKGVEVATEFGRLECTHILTASADGSLPLRTVTTIQG